MSVYRLPLILWAASLAGLLIAMVRDGASDLAAVGMVAVPLLAIGGAVGRQFARPISPARRRTDNHEA